MTARAVRWAVGGPHGSVCVVVNPASSYLWRLLGDLLATWEWEDVDLCRCMYGDSVRCPTRLRVFGGITLTSLGVTCRRTPTGFACGARAHVELGYGDAARPPHFPSEVDLPDGPARGEMGFGGHQGEPV